MAAPSKAEQVRESQDRQAAGVDPALNAAALDVADDGPRGDDGASPQRTVLADDPQQRTAPPVRNANDDKRADIISRFRTQRSEDKADDEVTGFERSGMPLDVEYENNPEVVDEQTPEVADAPQTIKLMVHGKEIEMSFEDVLAKAQIAMASDNVLGAAKDRLKEADLILEQMKEKAARAGQGGQHQPPQNNAQATELQQLPEDGVEHHDPVLKELVETLQFGDPEKAQELLRNTIADQVARTTNSVVAQTLQNQRLTDESARAVKVLKAFEEKHPDLATDKRARAAIESDVVDLQVEDIRGLGIDPNTLRKDGPVTPADIALAHRWYRANGFKVRAPDKMLEVATKSYLDWRGVKTEQTQPAKDDNKAPPRVDVTVDRGARRQAIPQQPNQASIRPRAPAQQQPDKPRDRSEIVQQMKLRTKGMPRSGGASVPAR